MTYLLAKYVMIFIMTAVTAFLLGRWSVSRKFVDVTEKYEKLLESSEKSDWAQWTKLWHRLDQIPAETCSKLRRIDRDTWVAPASRLHRVPDAAKRL